MPSALLISNLELKYNIELMLQVSHVRLSVYPLFEYLACMFIYILH